MDSSWGLGLVDDSRQAERVERSPRERLTYDVDGDEHHAGAVLPVGKQGLLERIPGMAANFGAHRLGPEAQSEQQAAAISADDVAPVG
jgi:hypothetical protein